MRRRVIGAGLTLLGVLSALFMPVHVEYWPKDESYSFWELIHWPAGSSWAFLPMVIIGVALVLNGIVLMGGVTALRPRLIGAAVTAVGVLAVLSAPVREDAVSESSGPFESHSLLGAIAWPPGWYWVRIPMLIIGFVLGVAGLILLSVRPEPAAWRGD
jgi:hypothetical protein